MTNLKKVLAFVVVFAMMLVGSVSAAGFPDVDDNASYAEAVSVLSSLKLMIGDAEGNFNPDKTITRAEAATIIVRAKGLENAAAGAKGATQFTDVAAGHWASGYINLACQNGIIAGYGDGTFGPEDQVTYEQITKMIVAALGYTPKAERQGGYPTGYLIIASQEGIAKGTSGTAGEPAARSTVARLLYNALPVQMMGEVQYSLDGVDKYGKINETLLYTYLDVTMYDVVITSTNLVEGDVESDYNYVRFGNATKVVKDHELSAAEIVAATNEISDVDAGATNALDYLGYSVVAYVGKDEVTDRDTVLAIAPKSNKNDSITLDYSKLQSFKDKTVKYLAKSTDKFDSTVELADEPELYLNGIENTTDVKAFLKQDTAIPGKVTFLDNNNDGKYDYVFVTKYGRNYVVGEIYESQQRLVDKDGTRIPIDLDDENVLYAFYNADGEIASFDDIQVNDVLTFAEGGDKLKSVYISRKVVEGTVSETIAASGKDEAIYTIGGEDYRMAKENGKDVVTAPKLNDEGTFYLNVDNRIVRKEIGISKSLGNYAYMYKAALPSDSEFDGLVQVQIVTATGENKILGVAKKLTVYKNKGTNGYEADSYTDSTAVNTDAGIYSITKETGENPVTKIDYTQGLFQYKTNSAGNISTIYMPYTGTDKSTQDSYFSLSASDKLEGKPFKASTVRLGTKYLQDDITVINVPVDAKTAKITDIDKIQVSTVGKTFVDDNDYTADLYDVDDYPTIIVAYGAKANIDPSTRLFVISKVTEGTNANGDDATRLYGYQNGEYVDAFLTDDVEVTGEATNKDQIKAGDVAIFSLDINGDIDKVQILMSADKAKAIKANYSKRLVGFNEGNDNDGYGYFGYASATSSNSRLTVQYAENKEETFQFKGDYQVYNVNINRATPVVKVSSYGDINAGVIDITEQADDNTYKKNVDYIFVRTYEDEIVDAVVYTFAFDELN